MDLLLHVGNSGETSIAKQYRYIGLAEVDYRAEERRKETEQKYLKTLRTSPPDPFEELEEGKHIEYHVCKNRNDQH